MDLCGHLRATAPPDYRVHPQAIMYPIFIGWVGTVNEQAVSPPHTAHIPNTAVLYHTSPATRHTTVTRLQIARGRCQRMQCRQKNIISHGRSAPQ
jgi:hypothetical protein